MLVSRAQDMMKEGTKHLSGQEEAVLRNIEACKELAKITRTSLGPNGMNKMVITAQEKLIVTSDAGTIVKELEVVHPAAKMIVMASKRQEEEVGDHTNLVIILAGELLQQAEALLRVGLHTSDVITGFEKAGQKVEEILQSMVALKLENLHDLEAVSNALKAAVASKHIGYEDILSRLISEACISTLPKNSKNFNVDNVRVAKIAGGGVSDSFTVKGAVVTRDVEGTIRRVSDAKIAIFTGGIGVAKTEGKGTLVLKNAEELLGFNKGEEAALEKLIKQIADSGVNVVISGGAVDEMAMHFLEKYKLMVIKTLSKFEIRRLCKTVGAAPMVRLGAPTAEEMGHCSEVYVDEIGSQKVIILKQNKDDSGVATIVVRAATQNVLDDIERAIEDGVNIYKALSKDNRLLAGAGAAEIELAKQLKAYAETTPGQEQYAINKYAESFEVVPRTIAENAGMNASEIISTLYSHHMKNDKFDGVDVYEHKIRSAVDMHVFDSYLAKHYAIKLATNTAITILGIDQLIMAKPAGGPKMPSMGGAMGGMGSMDNEPAF
jgi:T-complex protein 1 subunit theta